MEDTGNYIPQSRESQAAAVVGDAMFIFGGRSKEGQNLGDLACVVFRLGCWFEFVITPFLMNNNPRDLRGSPSPPSRSGHQMSVNGNDIYMVGGDPSDGADMSVMYTLEAGSMFEPVELFLSPESRLEWENRISRGPSGGQKRASQRQALDKS